MDHGLCIFDPYTDENQLAFQIGFPGSVYLLNNFDLNEFGAALLPHGFNKFFANWVRYNSLMNVDYHLYNIMLDYDIQAYILYVIIPKLYHFTLFYVIKMSYCIYAALCHIYMHSIYSLSKYGIITLTVETF